jgi:hypothetical protein
LIDVIDCSLIKKDGVYIIEPDNNFEIIE